MKTGLTIALCAAMAASGFAGDGSGKRKAAPGSALPPKSPMLKVSAPSEDVIQLADPGGLITTELWGRDLEFFRAQIEGGQLQLQLGDLVKARAQNEQVKSIGGALFASQEEENRQIAKLAGDYGFVISPNAGLGPQRVIKGIERLTGADFDRACVENIVRAIQATVQSYEEGSESQMAEIKSFAEQMLPVSRERLRIAENGLPKDAKAGAPITPLFLHAPAVPLRAAPEPAGVVDETKVAWPANGSGLKPNPQPLPVLPTPAEALPGSGFNLGSTPKDGPFSSPPPVPFSPVDSARAR